MPVGKVSLVGVGPGDPELITRKAERVLRAADVVYHPGPSSERGFAIRIVSGVVGPATEVRAAAVEMQEPGDRYETLAAELAAEARGGRQVAFITEGDPLLYSTASRLLAILRARWPELVVEVIPGVPSITAAAAAAGRSLVQGSETLLIVPACHHADELERLIDRHQCVVLVKIGSVFPQIVALVQRRGWSGRVIYAEKGGTPDERVVHDLASVDPATVSYFSLVLVDTRLD